MDYNGATTEVFASKFGPDGGHNKAHEENYNWLGRICDHRSESNRWRGNHGAILGEIFHDTHRKSADKWSIDFSVATFNDHFVAFSPFWHTGHNNCVADTFTQESER